MSKPRYFILDGKRYLWSEIVKMRREQIQAARQAAQLALFALQDDARPKSQRTAAGRLEEPTLFEGKSLDISTQQWYTRD
jgi:hypothetical protein